MAMSLTGISTPTTNPHAKAAPARAVSGQVISPELIKATASFTKRHGEFFSHPKYSLFVNGIRMLGEKDGGYFKGLSTFLGGLCILASPGWGVVRVVGGGVPAAVGAAATGVAATAFGIQELIRSIPHLRQASPKELRQHLMSYLPLICEENILNISLKTVTITENVINLKQFVL